MLVILRGGANAHDDDVHAAAHNDFISSLISRNLVLMGGAFADAVGDAYAAYVLRCSGVDEARTIAGDDPFVLHDVVRPECVEWELVGVNPEAIDPATILRPEDV